MEKDEVLTVETASLYKRLGATKGIAAIVDDVVEAHLNNPTIKTRFLPYLEHPEQVEIIKKHTVEFFAAGSGGPLLYTGRDMPTAHTGMNISPAEYMAAMDDVMTVLDKHQIDEASKRETLSILWSLKEMIIGK